MSDTVPTIRLADKEYPIPPLAIKQNRRVEPLAARHLNFFQKMHTGNNTINLLDLTDQEADDFTHIVYYAITRGAPSLTLEHFESMNISMREIMIALPVCLNQSGLFGPAKEAAPNTGEATRPSIGTES